MITVKLLGGAKKSFVSDIIKINENDLTIQKLLNILLEKKPKNTPDLDLNNTLVAVNGVESSALNGVQTKLKTNDVVSIIPIIHGGTNSRIQFKISSSLIEFCLSIICIAICCIISLLTIVRLLKMVLDSVSNL